VTTPRALHDSHEGRSKPGAKMSEGECQHYSGRYEKLNLSWTDEKAQRGPLRTGGRALHALMP
jgi:hypothetical protein